MQKICSICQSTANLKQKSFPGYVEGFKYDIFECSVCEASFVDPLKTDESVYDYMYAVAPKLVGYERYYRYFELVKKYSKPLSFLETTEPSYWAVIQQIKKNNKPVDQIKILEIGSGLGYVTYALRKAGYDAMGIDVSKEAVESAVSSLGQFYKVEDLFELSKGEERFDYVLMMDVIEHVESPVDFVQAALRLVAPQGELLITTPNKSYAPKAISLWQSDVPPVHLWFMSEVTLQNISEKAKAVCSFVEFTPYNKKFFAPVFSATIDELSSCLPRLNADGTIHKNGLVIAKNRNFLGLTFRYAIAYLRRRLLPKNYGARTTILCAIFKK